MEKALILIIEGNGLDAPPLRTTLEQKGFHVLLAQGVSKGLPLLQERSPHLLLMDASLPDHAGALAAARQIRDHYPIPLIMLVRESTEEFAIACLRLGVADYFSLPVSESVLVSRITSLVRPKPPPPVGTADLIGTSPAILAVRASIHQVAKSPCNVLITGESGTGKELVARLIHRLSPRQSKSFVCINCAAIPDTLLESELFGVERGAYTGAYARREGRLKAGQGGTILFDEIGDLSPYTQAKLLRAIEDKEIQRLGGQETIRLDIRVVAATHQPLPQLVAAGRFRQDLYFRLKVAQIHLPPLRDRKQDIPALAEHFLWQLGPEYEKRIAGISAGVLEAFLRHDWPGNIRELRNLCEAALVHASGPRIEWADLPEDFRKAVGSALEEPLEERDRLLSALLSTNWNKSQAAQRLNWSRWTLYRKMQKHQIHPPHELSAPAGKERS
ncbi:MAG: sigma-54-dependent transcriptional regulator [Candidatus Methylomirabilales bacterium]